VKGKKVVQVQDLISRKGRTKDYDPEGVWGVGGFSEEKRWRKGENRQMGKPNIKGFRHQQDRVRVGEKQVKETQKRTKRKEKKRWVVHQDHPKGGKKR